MTNNSQLNLYLESFTKFFESVDIQEQIKEAVDLIKGVKRIFFIGNGGSNAICSHMMEDYAKIGRFQTQTFSDPALITCYANDYGYEKAMEEWLKVHFSKDDLLIAISSSGKSMNIVNAANYVKAAQGKLVTLSGFKEGNPLSQIGDINFYLPVENYGIVECYHQVILHIILDEIAASR